MKGSVDRKTWTDLRTLWLLPLETTLQWNSLLTVSTTHVCLSITISRHSEGRYSSMAFFFCLWCSVTCLCNLTYNMVCFQADNIYRAGGSRWKQYGRCSTSLLEDIELASSLECPRCPLSTRVGDPKEFWICHNCEIVPRYNFWLVKIYMVDELLKSQVFRNL